ncbi:MAG TPA: Cof-type HAD-IIB family hydrolase [Ktedonobacteraceae bacterium]
MYRLLAIDLDGTLLSPRPQKMITARTRLALQQVVNAGIRVVIATGQSLAVLQAICGALPLTGPQIIENGAQIVDIKTGRIYHEHLLPGVYVLPVLTVLREAGLHRAYHTRDRVYADIDTPRVRQWYQPPVPPVIEIEDVSSLYPEPCIKVVAVGVESSLRAYRPEFMRHFAGQLYITQSAFDLLEFLHPDISKEHGLRLIARDLGIEYQEIVAIGDGHNDIGMLKFAGLGVAMGNAHDEVKSQADYITGSNAEDGVATAIEELILPALR